MSQRRKQEALARANGARLGVPVGGRVRSLDFLNSL